MTEVGHRAGPVRTLPGLRAVEHRFEVPLAPGDDRRVGLFAREVRAAAHAGDERPYLLMLNGGPGMANARPERPSGWLKRAIEDFHVVLLDQRGTGLSSPVTVQTLPQVGDETAQAEYLGHFRADAIVRDAELVRGALLGGEPWTVLGQSFGGFAAVTYLSFAPEGLREALITGGLPPLEHPADDVYRATFARLDARLGVYLDRYPEDRAVWEELVARDPRLRALGNPLGMSWGPERLHYLVERAVAAPAVFEEEARQLLSHTARPLYALLHEAIYAQGTATRWAAQRVLDERGEPPLLLGEMVLPSLFADEPTLRPFAEVAELLASREDWPALYDPARLAANEVPVAAAIYREDMYVEARFSHATAVEIAGLEAWPTSEYQHDGLHVGPVLDQLLHRLRDAFGP